MRRLSLPAMVLLLVLASPAHAQQWSAEQLEVWDVIQSQWAATVEKDASWPDRFLHDAFMGWENDQPVPRSKDSQQLWSRYGMENSTTLVQELYPIAIMVEGNTAVAHYFYSTAAEDRKGDRETTSGRVTDVLLNDEGTWRFIAWHGVEEAEDH